MIKIKKKILFLCSIFLVIAVVITTVFILISPTGKGITVYNAELTQLAFLEDEYDYNTHENAAYLQVVLTEAAEIYAQKNNCSLNTAVEKVLKSGWHIYTYFDTEVATSLQTACQTYGAGLNVGAAITTLKGDLLGVASFSQTESQKNFAVQKRPPHSSFKPLAVYAPAIEQKKMTWSSMYTDSPYSTILDADGQEKDWPVNATGKYSMQQTPIVQAISESLNTVAVKGLADLGVNNSIAFLEKNFSINLEPEKQRAQADGEDEIIGNIALGSIVQGCSAVDMAGYYQIFANGGTYCSPKAIAKICDDEGGIIYERQDDGAQVISPETAQIVTEMLKTVVTGPNGTAKNAYCKNVPVAGKTGTGDGNADNWFVGLTPQYSCAVWHAGGQKNISPDIFSAAIEPIEHKIKLFSTSPNVTQKIYCLQTGNLAGKNCKTFGRGFYANGIYIEVCEHNK